MEIIKNSFFFRAILALIKKYDTSFINGIFLKFNTLYDVSVSKKFIDKWLLKESRIGTSIYAKFLLSLHRRISKFNLLANSRILHIFDLFDVRKVILFCLAMYFPIDWSLRKVAAMISPVGLLASGWDEGLMLLSVMVIIVSYAKERSVPLQSKATPIDTALILFLAVSTFLMCLTTDYPSIAFAGYRAVIEYMVWFFIAIRLLRDDSDIKTFFYGLCLCGILIGLHGIYQYIVGAPMPEQWVAQAEVGVRTRVYSIIGSPNVMGSFMIMTAPMVLSLAYFVKNIWAKLALLAATGCLVLSLLFTFSRGAWGGFVLTALVFAILVDKRLIAAMAVAGTALLFLSPSIASRITFLFTQDFVDASAKGGRSLRWEIGAQMLQEHPWFGVGLGRFGGAVAMQNQILDKTDTFEYFYMDNYYLKTAVEMGYVGLAFFLILLAVVIIWSTRAIARKKGDPMSLMIKGAFAGMLGVLFHSYGENIFEVPAMNTYFWVLVAVIIFMGFVQPKSIQSKLP